VTPTSETGISRILIAGIGNIFFGDDAFGVEVARRLAQHPFPESVRVVDFGIRGLDLTYALLEPFDAVILVDTVSRGGEPGTVYVLEPELSPTSMNGAVVEAHSMDPLKVLQAARELGSTIERLLLVGCEPAPLPDDDEMLMELSAPVQAAVEEAVVLIESLVNQILTNDPRRQNRAGGAVPEGRVATT
jgi:hydrogenase maturation protease